MSGRPKRAAALKAAAVIEISDSDDDSAPNSSKRRRAESPPLTKLSRIDAIAEHVSNTTKRQRWPTAKAPGKVDQSKKCEKSANTVATNLLDSEQVEAIEQDLQARTDNVDGQRNSRTICIDRNECSAAAQSTGRNSFWARRKVWSVHELLAETEHIESNTARNIVKLLENENTIPFICRYRRDLINHITPERLRDIKNSYTEIVGLRKRAENIVTQLEKENQINEDVRTEIMCAKTNEELEFLYAPYKPASKGSLAERAKALGLEPSADRLLYGEMPMVHLQLLIDPNNTDLNTEEKVVQGICNIISHNISKHTGVLEELRRLQKVHRILLKCTKSKTGGVTVQKKNINNSATHGKNKSDASKYEHYYDFQADVRYLKPHQILAINRGEKQKYLTVKLLPADYVKSDIKRYTRELFLSEGLRYPLRSQVFEQAFDECYSKKLQPLMFRQLRNDLNEKAKKAAIDVFAQNLKQLLLQSPLKGERILGIDPGFINGCKLALISETADVLETGVIYPHVRSGDPEECGEQLYKMLLRHKCKIIALGNGTACRETEFWLSKLYENGILDRNTIRYSIVSEQGASIYSCSEIARKEFPNMDTNEISAASIARRLNDPLSEYVKIEPRHIGVGMYQHDINEKTLNESLNEVVSECVSYVGIDINTASISVLKHIAGLSEKKADKIIEYRLKNGCFKTRKDLLKVKSIGEKTFVQCAGFIRIEPRSVGGEIENLLDCTWVHPESYAVAKKIISKCKLQLVDMGSSDFIAKVKEYTAKCDIDELASDFKVPKERLEVVLTALQRELFQDYRTDLNKRPLFKQGVTRITELSVGDVLTGAVSNVTHFGAFIDIGIECDGLIHISKMSNAQLSIGDRVTVSITQIDLTRKRISLRLEEALLETDTSFKFA